MKKLFVNDGCIGCGACVGIDPNHFEFNDEGLSQVINQNNLATEELQNAMEACPVSVIHIEEVETPLSDSENCDSECEYEHCDCENCEGSEDECDCDDCNCEDCGCSEENCNCDDCECKICNCGCEECNCSEDDNCGCDCYKKEKTA